MVNTGREEFYIAFVKPNLHIAKQANLRRQQDFRCEFKIEPSNLIDSVFATSRLMGSVSRDGK